jgi:hypothetical protein
MKSLEDKCKNTKIYANKADLQVGLLQQLKTKSFKNHHNVLNSKHYVTLRDSHHDEFS